MKSACVVIGTRPEAIKLAPVIRALRSKAWEPRILSTGQHRDMLDPLLRTFELEPECNLGVMQSNHPAAAVLEGVSHVLAGWQPTVTVVQGDTTSAALAALASFYERIPVAHVEAGLRTYDLEAPFPEEANRQLIGRVAALHFAPTTQAATNLVQEGVSRGRIHVTGNTAIDSLRWLARRPATPPATRQILVTLHRREHHDQLEAVCAALLETVKRRDVSVLFPVHRNPRVRTAVESLNHPRIALTEPLGYPEFVQAMMASTLIITDSGGVQEEAPALGKPVLVTRDVTERPELIEAGAGLLVGCDPVRIVQETLRLLDDHAVYTAMAQPRDLFGDGHAAERIVEALDARFE